MACYADKEWVSEKPFLVGDSKTFTPGKPMPKPPSVIVSYRVYPGFMPRPMSLKTLLRTIMR